MNVRCAHPLKAFPVGKYQNGKTFYIIAGNSTKYVYYDSFEDKYVRVSEVRAHKLSKNIFTKYLEIPCGHCVFCHKAKARDWAARCMLESKYHDSNMFLTLTYDDEHVHKVPVVDSKTGELHEVKTLVKRDWQLFMKSLRQSYSDQKLRFFAAGEYGTVTFRPHMHAIIFGLQVDDLEPYKCSGDYTYYTSKKINSIWKKGFVVISQADYATMLYTAQYVLKKAYREKHYLYQTLGVADEFSLMSRKPGIGAQYFEEHPEVVEQSSIAFSTIDGGKKFSVPRYFRVKYDKILEEEDFQLLLEKKECDFNESLEAQEAIRGLLELDTDLDYYAVLAVQEENALAAQRQRMERDFI